jgi:glycosyltransferase involved in cell wall biosynthesis
MAISVVMSVYNGERWLREAIESVLDQTYRNFEFLIVDDGSTDGTPAVLAEYARRDERVRVFSWPNRGVSRSMNAVLPLARHDWIARVDADDLMHPERLERQLAFIELYPDLAVLSCFADYIDERGKQVGSYTNPLTSRATVRQWLETGRVIHFIQSGAIMRRDAVLAAGGYRPEFFVTEDTDLWNRIAEQGYGVLVQPEVLMQVRIHAHSLTRSAMLAQARQFRWLEAGARARRAGLPEPGHAELRERDRRAAWPQRLNTLRLDYGRVFYKAASTSHTQGRPLAMLGQLTVALLLFPSNAMRNVWSKAIRPQLPLALAVSAR